MSLKQEDREDRIRRYAYQIWLDAGLPDGETLACWQAAEEHEAAEESTHSTPAGESFPAGDPECPAAG
jgi:hypothetical protein